MVCKKSQLEMYKSLCKYRAEGVKNELVPFKVSTFPSEKVQFQHFAAAQAALK